MNTPNQTLAAILLTGAIYLAGPGTAGALTTNLVPVADTALRSSTPDIAMGSAALLPVGVSKLGTVRNRALFRFSLSDIPPDAPINGATLTVYVDTDPTLPANFSLCRVLRDWSEADATWNNRLPATAWAAGGGLAGSDFVSTPSATTSLSVGAKTFSSAGLVADVQAWVRNPSTNHGWILLAAGEPAATGKQVAAREDAVNFPVLTVSYTPPPAIYGTSLAGNTLRFSFDAESNHAYTVESRPALASGSWSVLTNIPAQPADTTLHITNTISSSERYFRVRTP